MNCTDIYSQGTIMFPLQDINEEAGELIQSGFEMSNYLKMIPESEWGEEEFEMQLDLEEMSERLELLDTLSSLKMNPFTFYKTMGRNCPCVNC